MSMPSQLVSNLKALLRALILVVLFGTGLWLMDQIAQTSTAVKSHGSVPKNESNAAAQGANPQMPPPEGYAPRPQGSAAPAAEPVSPAPATPEGAGPAPKPADASERPPSTLPSPRETREQPGGMLRIQRRGDSQYIVTEPILFSTASASIRDISIQPLKKVAALLSEKRDVKLAIIGYTDSLGLPENNQRVSAERAAAVRDFLISQGIDSSRLESRGMGSENPIASNDTQLGRQANRRIEFVVTSPK